LVWVFICLLTCYKTFNEQFEEKREKMLEMLQGTGYGVCLMGITQHKGRRRQADYGSVLGESRNLWEGNYY